MEYINGNDGQGAATRIREIVALKHPDLTTTRDQIRKDLQRDGLPGEDVTFSAVERLEGLKQEIRLEEWKLIAELQEEQKKTCTGSHQAI